MECFFILSGHIADMGAALRAFHFASKISSLITISQQRNSLTKANFKPHQPKYIYMEITQTTENDNHVKC